MRILDLIEKYIVEISKGKKERTRKAYLGRIKVFKLFMKKIHIEKINDLQKGVIDAFIANICGEDYGVNTKYVYLEYAKKFLGWLYENHYIFFNLSENIILPKWERKKKKQYTVKQVEKITAKIKEPEAIKIRDKLIVTLYLLEGLRTGDLERLSVIDVDLMAKEIRLLRKKKFQAIKKETTKLLKEYLQKRNDLKPKNDWLLIKNGGERLGGARMSIILKETRKK